MKNIELICRECGNSKIVFVDIDTSLRRYINNTIRMQYGRHVLCCSCHGIQFIENFDSNNNYVNLKIDNKSKQVSNNNYDNDNYDPLIEAYSIFNNRK